MKRYFLVVFLIGFTQHIEAQAIDLAEYLNGKWCDNDEIECFKIVSADGLLTYETLTGDFRAGVEIVDYNPKTKIIRWQIIRTNKKVNQFKILGKNRVEYNNNNRRIEMRRME